jgi:hypothetical protein
MHSEHHQPAETFHRLVRLAHERHTRVIDPPDVALAAFNKARLHEQLMAAGLRVPFTIIVPLEEADAFRLAEEQREALEPPFIIKPALGYGRKGLVMDATSERDLLRSIEAWPDTHYLLQRRIVPRQCHGAPAYFRVYYAFGTVWFSWWNCYTDLYRLVTPEEREREQLQPLEDIIRRLAALTGMNYFSSEIAQTDSGEFVLIDYVNDQCHMLSQSAHPRIGVPDELVKAVAKRLVEGAREWIIGTRG